MAGSIDMFFVDVSSAALALGGQTMTDTVTSTAAWPGAAIGYGAAVAVAQDTAPGTPVTSATTDAIATGGYMTSSQGSHWSVDFPYGPTPTSVDVSLTFVATHGVGDALSGYDLVSSSLHGLL
jgi:hypothetical protein